MSLRFGVFDHIEPVPGMRLDQIYRSDSSRLSNWTRPDSTRTTWRNTTPRRSTA